MKFYLNCDEIKDESRHNLSACIWNASAESVFSKNICFDLVAIPSNSEEMVKPKKKIFSNEMKLAASGGKGWLRFITHDALKEACSRGGRRSPFNCQSRAKQIIFSSTGTLKRKCSAAGDVLENVHKKMRDADFVLLCNNEPAVP